jgi:hypothetical protein
MRDVGSFVREVFAMRRRRAAALAVSVTLLAGCISPLYTWDTHSASTPRSLDVAELGREPVATLGLVAPPSLQGFAPALSHALVAALAETSPPIRGALPSDAVSALNEQGLASEYAELLAGFNRSGILDRDRLGRIGSALGCRYVLLPGLAAFDHVIVDRFEIWGFKMIRNRVAVLRLWLQLWDARTGRIVWQSAGEVTAASELVNVSRVIPLDELAQKLWRRMIQEDLLAKST